MKNRNRFLDKDIKIFMCSCINLQFVTTRIKQFENTELQSKK